MVYATRIEPFIPDEPTRRKVCDLIDALLTDYAHAVKPYAVQTHTDLLLKLRTVLCGDMPVTKDDTR